MYRAIKMHRASHGLAPLTDLLKCPKAIGKGFQSAWGVKGITKVMTGLIYPVRGQGKAIRAVRCPAGAIETAEVQILVL